MDKSFQTASNSPRYIYCITIEECIDMTDRETFKKMLVNI